MFFNGTWCMGKNLKGTHRHFSLFTKDVGRIKKIFSSLFCIKKMAHEVIHQLIITRNFFLFLGALMLYESSCFR
jgi:hypothetical protein